MQITFDPLNDQEAAFVLDMLAPQRITIDTPVFTILPHADRPDVGASPEVPFAPSAAPLAPAPSIAAAELFPNAPAAETVLVPPAPPVPAPPVAAVPPAPPVPSAPASMVSPVPGVEADSTGLPWDERIHSGTKATNADGSWRKRRGLNDEALVKAVEAELRAGKVAAPPAVPPGMDGDVGNVPPAPTIDAYLQGITDRAPSAATAVVPPPPVIPAGPSVVPAPPVPAGVPMPTTPPAPVATAPASTDGFEIAFGPLMSLITGNIASGKLTEPQVHEIMARPGCELRPEQIGVLAGDSDRRNLVGHALTQLLGV